MIRQGFVSRLGGADGFGVDSGGGQSGHEIHEFVLDIVRDAVRLLGQ
ncbi:hypothetical protein [Kutzneria sp. NPDC051319]